MKQNEDYNKTLYEYAPGIFASKKYVALWTLLSNAYVSLQMRYREIEELHHRTSFKACFTCGYEQSIDGTAGSCVRCLQARVNWLETQVNKVDPSKSKPQSRHVCGLSGFGIGVDGWNDKCPGCEEEWKNRNNDKSI